MSEEVKKLDELVGALKGGKTPKDIAASELLFVGACMHARACVPVRSSGGCFAAYESVV